MELQTLIQWKNRFILSLKIWIWIKLPLWCRAHGWVTLTERNVWWQRTQLRLPDHNNCFVVLFNWRRMGRFSGFDDGMALFAALDKISFGINIFGLLVSIRLAFDFLNGWRCIPFSSCCVGFRCACFMVAVRIWTSSHLAFAFTFEFWTQEFMPFRTLESWRDKN